MQTEQDLRVIGLRFSNAMNRMIHVLKQLNDEQLWLRPSANVNSVGILVQHLQGNLHQWVLAAIGGETFHRHRAQEFEDRDIYPKKLCSNQWSCWLKRFRMSFPRPAGEPACLPPNSGIDETVMSALLDALTHLELHTGQMTLLSKLILGDTYQEYWKPENTEQGK